MHIPLYTHILFIRHLYTYHSTYIHSDNIRQKNEGGWEFTWDEDEKKGFVQLNVKLSSYLDSSLIDVDIHPLYISIVIKTKVSLYTYCM